MTLSDDVLALIMGLSVRGVPGFGSLLFEASVRLDAGLLASGSPGLASLALPHVFATWASRPPGDRRRSHGDAEER
jgi:hypothetical protein